MNNTTPKPNLLWLKKWWKDWAKLDLTILPIGVGFAFYLKDSANGFWLNLSTELIGAYISVRFIDFLLKRNENRHYQRQEIAGNINWFYENADRIIPDFYDWRIKDLELEIKYFDDRWDERKHLLEEDEKKLIGVIKESRRKIVDLAKDYINLYQATHRVENDVYNRVSDVPKWWRELQDSFQEYRKTILNAEEIITPPLEKALLELEKSSKLSIDEINILRDLTTKFQQLISIRNSVEEEVRNHEKLTYNLKNNIYQESG